MIKLQIIFHFKDKESFKSIRERVFFIIRTAPLNEGFFTFNIVKFFPIKVSRIGRKIGFKNIISVNSPARELSQENSSYFPHNSNSYTMLYLAAVHTPKISSEAINVRIVV